MNFANLPNWVKFDKKSMVHMFLVVALILALPSRGKTWSVTPDVTSLSVGSTATEVDIAVMCATLKDGLLSSGLVVGLHASLERDESDYQMLSTSTNDDGLFVSINEQRQLVLYFGKASSGYEMSSPDPEFIADVSKRIIDKDGQPVVDKLDTTIFITRLDELSDQVALEAMTSSPFLSTVVKIIPLSSITNLGCGKTGTLGLGISGTSAGLDIGKTGKTSKASMLRSIYTQRSVASLLMAMWLMSLWFTRKKDDVNQAVHV